MSQTTANIDPIIALCESYNANSAFPKRAWLELPGCNISIYVRRTKRLIKGTSVETLDLASFNVDPELRGKGLFTEILGLIEEYAWKNGLTIFVENVHNDRLRDFLSRRGYETGEAEDLCYYRSEPE